MIPSKCPDCGTWFQNEHRCTPFVADTQTNTVTNPYFFDYKVTI